MQEMSSADAFFAVTVRVRRNHAGKVSVRFETDPKCSPEAIRELSLAVDPVVAARLAVGAYEMNRTARFGTRLVASPGGAEPEVTEELVRALVRPMDDLLRALIDSIESIPTEERMFDAIRELYASILCMMSVDGTIGLVRLGFCKLEPCDFPSGLSRAFRFALERGETCQEGRLPVSRLPVVIVRDASLVRVFLGVIGDRNPFRALYLRRFRAIIQSVQSRAEIMEMRIMRGRCAEEALRMRLCAEAMDAAIGQFGAQPNGNEKDRPDVPEAVWGNHDPGDA